MKSLHRTSFVISILLLMCDIVSASTRIIFDHEEDIGRGLARALHHSDLVVVGHFDSLSGYSPSFSVSRTIHGDCTPPSEIRVNVDPEIIESERQGISIYMETKQRLEDRIVVLERDLSPYFSRRTVNKYGVTYQRYLLREGLDDDQLKIALKLTTERSASKQELIELKQSMDETLLDVVVQEGAEYLLFLKASKLNYLIAPHGVQSPTEFDVMSKLMGVASPPALDQPACKEWIKHIS